MIFDITNEVFTQLKSQLNNVTVLTSYPSTKPNFPCVIFTELSNITHIDSVDSSGENHNDVSFEINIFSNAKNKISESKAIRTIIDNVMSQTYSMNRDSASETPNFADTNIYRYTLRYSCIIDDNTIYRR